jgi:hypothetical protein
MTANKSEERAERVEILKLFENRVFKIPNYQRIYAWREEEITTLLQDICNWGEFKARSKDDRATYYLGTLICYDKTEDGETVKVVCDGQQRLTTLFLLFCALPHLKATSLTDFVPPAGSQLRFASRPKSEEEIKRLTGEKGEDSEKSVYGPLQMGSEIIRNYLKPEENPKTSNPNNIELKNLMRGLENTAIFLVQFPKDLDWNHYFVTMNSQGKQLKPTDVLKARFIEKLQNSETLSLGDGLKVPESCVSEIWDALADMNHYFIKKLDSCREESSSKGGDVEFEEFSLSELVEAAKKIPPKEFGNDSQSRGEQEEQNPPESIIDFDVFLIHAMRIYQEEKGKDFSKSASYQELLPIFKKNFDQASPETYKDFFIFLMELRLLFDAFIVRTESDYSETDGEGNDFSWVIKSCTRKSGWEYQNTFESDKSQHIVMLQSCIRVTYRNPANRWISTFIKQLRKLDRLKGEEIFSFLLKENTENRKKWLKDQEQKIYEILREMVTNKVADLFPTLQECLGTSTDHLLFNYLDYCLWELIQEKSSDALPQDQLEFLKENTKETPFRFAYRSSVEHFFPQHPSKLSGEEPPSNLDDFGNLCLTTVSDNSTFTNMLPEAKVFNFKRKVFGGSLKLRLMANITKKGKEWGYGEISKHGQEMQRILENNIPMLAVKRKK